MKKTTQGNSIMGVIRCTFKFLNIKTLRLLYTSLLGPGVEYANQVWNPYLKKQPLDMLEKCSMPCYKVNKWIINSLV